MYMDLHDRYFSPIVFRNTAAIAITNMIIVFGWHLDY